MLCKSLSISRQCFHLKPLICFLWFWVAVTICSVPQGVMSQEAISQNMLPDNPMTQIATSLKQYRQGELSLAKDTLRKILDQLQKENMSPSPSVLTNLGIIEYQQGQVGLALGLWRKALFLDPSLGAAQEALDYGVKNLKVKALPHKETFYESFRENFLVKVSLDFFLASQGCSCFLVWD